MQQIEEVDFNKSIMGDLGIMILLCRLSLIESENIDYFFLYEI